MTKEFILKNKAMRLKSRYTDCLGNTCWISLMSKILRLEQKIKKTARHNQQLRVMTQKPELKIEAGRFYRDALNAMAVDIYNRNHQWWHNERGERLYRNKGELLALIHSEVSEALEGERKDLMDDKLPNRKMAEVEMADVLIRVLDYCAGFNYDIGGAVVEKLAYNQTREDHKIEARMKAGGKKF